ncbi:MAG: flagellar basal body-associated protein FliL [Acidobacteriota bacterium]
MSNPEKKDNPGAAPKPPKSKLTLILLAMVIILAGTAGFFGWNYFKGQHVSAAEPDEGHEKDSDHSASEAGKKRNKSSKSKKEDLDLLQGATLTFEPFLVNLADTEASRYLKVSMRLLVSDKEVSEKISGGEVYLPRMRDCILSILSTKRASEIVTNEGKAKLKKEILEALNEFLPEEAAQDVFFTDFVVQL